MPDVETVPEKTVDQVAAEALASWRAAKDSGPGEASMRQQLEASSAVRRAGGRQDEWAKREAEIEAEHKQAQADRAAAESHRREQESYLAFAKSRYELAMKNGNKAVAEVWFEAAEAIVDGKFLHSKVINSDPAITKFQSLRTRLAYEGKVIRHA